MWLSYSYPIDVMEEYSNACDHFVFIPKYDIYHCGYNYYLVCELAHFRQQNADFYKLV